MNLIIKENYNIINPCHSYLSRFIPSSRETMEKSLRRIVNIVTKDSKVELEEFPWHNLGPEHINIIKNLLQEKVLNNNLSSNTANLSLKALRGLLKECWRLDYITEEKYKKTIDFKNIRGEKILVGRHIENYEIKEIIKNFKDDIFSVRDLAMISIIIGTGIRRSEVCKITIKDLQNERIKIIGKGNKERVVYLPQWTISYINNWVSIRGEDDGYFICKINRFTNKTCPFEGITPPYVLKIIEKRVGNNIKTHDFRRTFIGKLLDVGVDISTVSKLAGHSQITTTARYDRRDEQRKIDAMKLIDKL